MSLPVTDHVLAAREAADGEMSDLDALVDWAWNLVDDHHAGGEHLDALAEIADELEAGGQTEVAAELRAFVADPS